MAGKIKIAAYWLAGLLALSLAYLWIEFKNLRFDILEIRIDQSTKRPRIEVKAALFNPFWFNIPVKVRSLDILQKGERLFTGNRNLKLRLEGQKSNRLEFNALYTKPKIAWEDVAKLLDQREELTIQMHLQIFGFEYVYQKELTKN